MLYILTLFVGAHMSPDAQGKRAGIMAFQTRSIICPCTTECYCDQPRVPRLRSIKTLSFCYMNSCTAALLL